MTHKHSVYDTDTHFIIDPKTRTFSNESSLKTLVVKNDINSERFTFELPRLIDGHDMSLCNKVEIHYINIENGNKQSSKDVYDADDLQVSPEDDNIVIFSWILRGNATKYNGTLSFSICFKCLEADEITYSWNTLIYSKLSVGESYSNTEDVVQEYSDVLEKWKLELIEAGTLTDEDISSAVNDYMSRNPISLSSLEQDEEHRLVTDTEKEAWNGKSDFSGNYEDLTNKPTIPTKTSQLDNDSQFSTFSGSYNDLSDKPTIPREYTLPIATPTTLGGVKPIAKTDEMTQEVGVDELGGLFTKEGGSTTEENFRLIVDFTLAEDAVGIELTEDVNGQPFELKEIYFYIHVYGSDTNTSDSNAYIGYNFNNIVTEKRVTTLSGVLKKGVGTSNKQIMGHATLSGGYIETFTDSVNGNYTVYVQGALDTSRATNLREGANVNTKITGFHFGNPWNSFVLGAGTVFRVYGR